MLNSISNSLKEIWHDIQGFLEKYYSEPFFWLAIFLVLFAVSMIYITRYANK